MERVGMRRIGLGFLAGIAGGVVLGAFLVAMRAVSADYPWGGLVVLGSRLVEPGRTTVGPVDASVLAGAAALLGVAAIWGLFFGYVFHGLTRFGTIVAGLVWGFAVWGAMSGLILPLAGLGEVRDLLTPVRWIVAYLLFGLTVAIAYRPAQPVVPRILRARRATT